MQINDEMIDKLAVLSRLSFNGAEKEMIKKDLKKMIGFVEKLNEIDTSGIDPLLHISPNINVMREDVVHQQVSREEALVNANTKDDSFFKVPKVIKK